jgi:hypothetical protein
MMQPRQNRRRGDISVSLDRAAEGRKDNRSFMSEAPTQQDWNGSKKVL